MSSPVIQQTRPGVRRYRSGCASMQRLARSGPLVFRIILGAIVVFAGLGAPLGPPAAVSAQDDPGADQVCADGWRSMPLPRAARRTRPYEIIIDGGAPAWLVGGNDGKPLVLRWRSGRWVAIDAPPADLPASEPAALHDAALAPDGSLLAVGYTRPVSRIMQPLSGRFEGRTWQERPIGDIPGRNVSLAGVAPKGRNGAWAVGSRLEAGRTQAYALRWSGSRWVRGDPALGSGESGLTAVSTDDRNRVWSVGWADDDAGLKRPLILRAAGRRWQPVSAPEVPEGIGVLTDVDFRGHADGWAAGYLVPAGGSVHEPILFHWDGSGWNDVPVTWSAGVSYLPRSLALADDGGIWMAGTRLLPDQGPPQGFVAHAVDGAAGPWTVSADMLPVGERSEAFAVAATREGAIVSGVSGRDAFVIEATCAVPEDAGLAAGSTSWQRLHGAPVRSDVESDRSEPTGRALTVGEPIVVPQTVAPQIIVPQIGSARLAKATRPEGFSIRDVARRVGLSVSAVTLDGLAADLNGDGWQDVFFWNHDDRHHFFVGGPDGFRKGPVDAFGQLDRHGCTAADIDADGVQDVFCSAGRARGSAIDRHELSLRPGLEDGGVDHSVGGIEDPLGRGRAATFIQLDDDGLPDLFIANSPDRGDALPGTNRFFRNVGGRFVAAPEVGLDTSVGGRCAIAADIDDDGDEDLLVCQEHPSDRRAVGLRVFRNDEGRLRERSRRPGIQPIEDIDVVVADVTGDGRADIVQLSHTRLRVSRGRRDGRFEFIFEVATPNAEGIAVGDANGDGAADLYIVRGSQRTNDRDLLLINGGRGRSFTPVRLPQARRGSGADVMAIDHDQNGLTDFVVLNGRGTDRGPVQLLASFPDG